MYYMYYLSKPCGGLNGNFLHRLWHLNIQFPVCGFDCVGLRDVVLMKEICHWGKDLRFQRLASFPVSFLCFLLEFHPL